MAEIQTQPFRLYPSGLLPKTGPENNKKKMHEIKQTNKQERKRKKIKYCNEKKNFFDKTVHSSNKENGHQLNKLLIVEQLSLSAP